jgi:hypothetical protein
MGCKVSVDKQLDEIFRKATEIIRQEVVRALAFLCEECVSRVRDRSEIDSWYDHTGNLRSSVGYAIYEHGELTLASAFESVKGGTEGSAQGQRLVRELAKEYTKAYSAVIMAAMTYAEYVEACKNKDVLASTEIWAKSKVDDYIRKALDKAVKKINAL